jgi:N-acetylneuraminic acid mutarotase
VSNNLKKLIMTYKAKKIYKLFFLFLLIPFFFSCEKEDEDFVGNWVELSSLNGMARTYAVGFTIGSKGYIGTGYNGIKDDRRLNDFWEYDAELDNWTQKADFPGVARQAATGFGLDTMGYIGTGYDGREELNDFYEYHPKANTWTKIKDYPGSARYWAIGFSINNIGYVGTGYNGDTNEKDFWSYNPKTGEWSTMTALGGEKRKGAACFVIDGLAYVTTGWNNGPCDDLWVYDPGTGVWTEKRKIDGDDDEEYDDDYTGITGSHKVGFAINGKGYVATGGPNGAGKLLWEYDPADDLWYQRQSFESDYGKMGAVGWTIGKRGYVVAGGSALNSGSYYDDLWAFDPSMEYDKQD